MATLLINFTFPGLSMLRLTCSYFRGANFSPFGEIRRFHLEIGHSRESCRSVKKNAIVVVSASHLLSSHL